MREELDSAQEMESLVGAALEELSVHRLGQKGMLRIKSLTTATAAATESLLQCQQLLSGASAPNPSFRDELSSHKATQIGPQEPADKDSCSQTLFSMQTLVDTTTTIILRALSDLLSQVEQSEVEQSQKEQFQQVEQSEVEQSEVEQSEVEQFQVEQSEVEQFQVEQSEVEQSEVEQSEVEQSEVEQF